MEVGHLLLKIHFCVGYPPLGKAIVKKWVVSKKNLVIEANLILIYFQNLSLNCL